MITLVFQVFGHVSWLCSEEKAWFGDRFAGTKVIRVRKT